MPSLDGPAVSEAAAGEPAAGFCCEIRVARDGDCSPEAAAGLDRALEADPGVGAPLPAVVAVADSGDDRCGGSGNPMMLGWAEGTRQGGRAGLDCNSVEAR